MTRRRIIPWFALIATVALAGCAPTPTTEVPDDAIIIDVRTPAEFTEGHLDGALNIDVQSADFDDQIAALDPDEDYLVYCQSGNRSAAAIDRMDDAGFTDLHDGGSLASAAEITELPIIAP